MSNFQVLTISQIRTCENKYIKKYSFNKLINLASKKIADFLLKKFENKKILFICGFGNNGKDGVLAFEKIKTRTKSSIILIDKNKKIEEKIVYSLINKTDYLMWLKDKDVIKYLYRQELFSGIEKKQIYKYVSNLDKSKNDFFYLIKINKKIIGTVKLGHIDWYAKTGDVGIMIGDRDYWNHGYGFDSMVGLLDHMFTYRGMYKIYLHTLVWNTRAQKSFQKCGFTIIETVRKYGYDFMYMELEKNNWTNNRASIMQSVEKHGNEIVDFDQE